METATTTVDTTEAPLEGQEPRLLTLREAAERCGISHTAMRKRADRGGLATVKREGVRCVPLSELERHGLLPDAELVAARRRVEELEREVAEHRQLVESTERARAAEHEAMLAATEAAMRHRAEAEVASQRLEERAAELAELEERLERAGRGLFGPIRSWALSREIAELRAEREVPA